MSWRPKEGWKNPHAPDKGGCQHAAIFEAGADGIVQALKAEGTYITSSHIDSDMEGGEGVILTSGWWLFILDEEAGDANETL